MPVTLADLAKQSKEPLEAGIRRNLLRASKLLEILPIVQTKSLSVISTRWNLLPTVGWRRIGTGYTEDTGTTEQVQEGMFAIGHDIALDRAFDIFTEGVLEDPRTTQINMALQALAFAFNNILINGDTSSDPDTPDGLAVRAAAMPARMSFRPATGTDAYDPTTSAATMNVFLDKVNELIYKLKPCKALLMNEGMVLGVSRVLRRSGLLDTTKDQFGRMDFSFMGIPLVDVGVTGHKSTTEIILNTEDPGDAGNDTTSIYGIRTADPDGNIESPGSGGFFLMQGSDLTPYDPLGGGEKEARPEKLVRIDWWLGFNNGGDDYNIGRLHSIETPASWT